MVLFFTFLENFNTKKNSLLNSVDNNIDNTSYKYYNIENFANKTVNITGYNNFKYYSNY